MKKTTVVVIVTLLCWSQRATAGGTLSFLDLYYYSSVYGDDSMSSQIYISGGFNFGRDTLFGAYVSTNGAIILSRGVFGMTSVNIPRNISKVNPYAATLTLR